MYPGSNQRGTPISYTSSNLGVPRFLQPSPLMFPSRQNLGFATSQGLPGGVLPTYFAQINTSSNHLPSYSVNSYPTYANHTVVREVCSSQPSLSKMPCLAPSRVALGEINSNKPDSGSSHSRTVSLQSVGSPLAELAVIQPTKSEISVGSPTRRQRSKGELVSIRVAEIEQRTGTHIKN